MQKVVFYTQHPANQTITQFFSKSQNLIYENFSLHSKHS